MNFTDNNINYTAALLKAPKMIGASTIEETAVGSAWTGARFNVTNTTELIGSLTGDLSDKNVYVIFEFGTNNNVKTAYIVDKAAPEITNPTVTEINPTITVAAENLAAGKVLGAQTVTLTNNTATVNGITVVVANATAKWYDATTGAFVADTDRAIAGHVYTQIVTVTVADGYKLGASTVVTGFTKEAATSTWSKTNTAV